MIEPDWDVMLDQAATAAGISIPKRYRAAVIAYLKMSFAIAQPMLEFELPGDAEPAPVFRP